MNDFVNQFWNWYVILLVLVSIIACGVMLWTQSLPAPSKLDTTGHVWDETLEEYNNPLPKWWMWLFYITVIFSLVYAVLYPTLGSFPGLLGWSSSGQWAKEMARADEQFRPLYAKYMQTDVKALAADKEANETGKRLYLTYCMQCHGADARGSKGFPNLADNDWQWGGEPAQVLETINNGRIAMMPPYSQLGSETIKDLANYVRSLSGLPADSLRVAKGTGSLQHGWLLGLSRAGREGHDSGGRSQPDRQGLALRQLGSDDHRDHHQRPQ
jgi:cytochrome c oxidase cbb3-type subunit 3